MRAHEVVPQAEALDSPLGAARAQVHDTYIIAQTRDGVVIVDQHAAHERLVYENLKKQREEKGIARQMLLIPAVIDLDQAAALIELTQGGKNPISLPGGESRTFLEDGDAVVLRGWCEKPGAARIGFGECWGTVLPARP